MSLRTLGSNTTSSRGMSCYTTAPVITGTSALNAGWSGTFSVTTSYVQPQYSAQVVDSSGAVVVANAAVTKSSAVISFTAPAVGSYTLMVTAQDYGKQVSQVTSVPFTTTATTFRYWRVKNFTSPSISSYFMIGQFNLFTGAGHTGTAYPGNMTANNAPSPYVVSGRYAGYSGYEVYKAFDHALGGSFNTFYWTLSSPNTVVNEWVTIDAGAAITALSLAYTQGQAGSGTVGGFSLYGSSTGSFAGEESLIIVVTGLNTADASTTYIG